MPFKDILVYVDGSSACAARLAVAVTLAEAHGAHLIGLHVRFSPQMPNFILAEYGGQISMLQEKYAAEMAETAKVLFDNTLAKSDLSREWRDVIGDPLVELPRHARYAGLAVVGQGSLDDGLEDGVVDQLLLDAGRPVLVVPCVGLYPVMGDRILVAWNASREATRAVADALPLLQAARQVTLLSINARTGDGDHGDVPGADIARHLARNGVSAVVESLQADDVEVGAMVLSRIADDDADLLVMGGYGHSRLRQWVLGGVTRHVLQHMTVPVLLSH